jgi:hypothetical protein
VGILAYGSLLSNPGRELAQWLDTSPIRVETPFRVEFARSSEHRAGAPTLVPISGPHGSPVSASILVLKDWPEGRTSKKIEEVEAMLYRRERGRDGDLNDRYDDKRQRSCRDGIVIERSYQLQVPLVLYATLPPNLLPVLDPQGRATKDVANELARRAVKSLNKETFASRRDGIAYLADVINCGISTPLTQPFKEAILLQTGANTLEEARQIVARNQGIPAGDNLDDATSQSS